MNKSIRYELREDGVLLVIIDVPGQNQNTIQESWDAEFRDLFQEIERQGAKAVVLTSGKKTSWVAGADIEMLERFQTAEEAEHRSRDMQALLDELEGSSVPFVAAIHGACLGGGLEIALACHDRFASDANATKLGLPEVQLGVLPGAGGTQRLPRTVGLEKALELLVTGRQLDAKRAKKIGLVSEVVAPSILVEAAAERALALVHEKGKKKTFSAKALALLDGDELRELAIAHNPAGRNLVFSQAEKGLRAKAGDHYPAPYQILEVVRIGLEKGPQKGLEAEAKAFGKLAVSGIARRLMEIFFAQNSLKKDLGVDSDVKPSPVSRIGIIGAGFMGHGIAFVSIDKAQTSVRMRDRDDESVAKGLVAVRKLVEKKLAKRRISEREAERELMLLSGSTDYSGFGGADIVIEAVFEDLELKHQVLKDVQAVTKPTCIFASNTSSIPISEIAKASLRPERVVGMHYFSPVEKMPLLEIIRTRDTLDEVVATVVELGKRQGKTVIVVNDGVGFYTSRILGPYMNEAAWMLADGVPVEVIDQAARQFGFPVGPITLLDEVGIDVAAKVSGIARKTYGNRMDTPGILEKLVADGRSGRKGSKGFYEYGSKRKGGQRPVDESVYEVLGLEPKRRVKFDTESLGEQLALAMVLEAIRCLEENILRNPRDGDIGAIFGLGFPPFRGGPFRYGDSLGMGELLRRVSGLEDRFGRRFQAPGLLGERARSGQRFYEG